MVKRKCVKPLRHFCLKSLPHLVAGHVREVSTSSVNNFRGQGVSMYDVLTELVNALEHSKFEIEQCLKVVEREGKGVNKSKLLQTSKVEDP